ncbi:MAG: GGDEF domain-containing protein [Syntrophothermus sp.]|uniref:GGDEF domain-containing protein n=1 Tax=Syntrophothermus sp. TaxID=2736299 RepID=UPI00257A8CD5|nr:GGDEF domain-containing protein [Syntrophothermus sp.]NSW83007.1 GGDEF domain-containing protein [Syntrophothermus sp.]
MMTGLIHNSSLFEIFARTSLCLLYLFLIILFFRNRHKMSARGKGWSVLTIGLFTDWIGEVLDLVSVVSGSKNAFINTAKYVFFDAGAFLIVLGGIFWVRKLARTIDKLAFENVVDPLTRAYNRRFLAQHFEQLLPNRPGSNPLGQNSAIAIIDVDNFKSVNDRYGHVYGDSVLKKLVLALKANLRRDDYVIRYGGDEFVLICYNVGPDERQIILDRVNKALSSVALPRGERLTASVGLAFSPQDGTRFEDLVATADERMYSLKNYDRKNTAQQV